MVINILSSTQQTTGVNMKKLTLNKKEHEYLLKNNPAFLNDKNVVIKNDTTNIMIQKTKRYLIDNTDTVDFKYFVKVS
jgi:hypothetical protein